MTEEDYYNDLLGRGKGDPDYHKRYVGDTPKVERITEGWTITRRQGYPQIEDQIDYNPLFDEDWEDIND